MEESSMVTNIVEQKWKIKFLKLKNLWSALSIQNLLDTSSEEHPMYFLQGTNLDEVLTAQLLNIDQVFYPPIWYLHITFS